MHFIPIEKSVKLKRNKIKGTERMQLLTSDSIKSVCF